MTEWGLRNKAEDIPSLIGSSTMPGASTETLPGSACRQICLEMLGKWGSSTVSEEMLGTHCWGVAVTPKRNRQLVLSCYSGDA